MKIRKVKWNNHPILGNLELEFLDAAGVPFQTIIFAGENGAGKTTVLESISTFLNKGSFEYFEFIEYEVGGNILKAVQPTTDNKVGFYDMLDEHGTRTNMYTSKAYVNAAIDDNPQNIRFSGFIFSKARADYKTTDIKAVTTSLLDGSKVEEDQNDNFTSLKQLLVDIESQDNAEYTSQNKALGTQALSWTNYYPNSKLYRFKNSFDSFFEKIKYENVQDVDSKKEVFFSKNGSQVPIDSLSTGEKQIVYRGSFLLKNVNALNDACVFIDEPELSMHPLWQKKVLKYFKDLFSLGGVLSAQMFFASHSEHVLKNALMAPAENLVIVFKENNGTIQVSNIIAPNVLPSITSAETNYLAFDLATNDYHIELYGFLQNKHGLHSVKACDNHIKGHALFNTAIHGKSSVNPHGTTYDTLSTYIRNAIDHPDPARQFTDMELRTSIDLLIELCR